MIARLCASNLHVSNMKTLWRELDLRYEDYYRYKIVVEVVIGEQRGEGVRMGSRCLWDSDTDNYASCVYMNDSLFCCAAVFGLYYY